jgi:hypothetical protein
MRAAQVTLPELRQLAGGKAMLDRENSTTSKSQSLRILRHGTVLVLFALLMVACGKSDGPGGSSEATQLPATATDAATPAIEGSGPEEAAPGGNGGPAVKTASLPIGGGADDSWVRQQCIGVGWLGGEKTHLGEEASVKVTKVRTDRPNLFKPSSFDCPSEPCDSFTFDSDSDVCYAAITIAEKASGSAHLFLDGQVVCLSRQQQSCEDFANRLEGKAIEISAPDASPTASQTSDETSPEPSSTSELPSPTAS